MNRKLEWILWSSIFSILISHSLGDSTYYLALRCFFRWDNFWVLKPQKKTVTSIRFLQKKSDFLCSWDQLKICPPRLWMLPTVLIFISIQVYWGGSNCETTFTKVIYLCKSCCKLYLFRARHIHSCNLMQSYIFLNIISTPFINLNWGCH